MVKFSIFLRKHPDMNQEDFVYYHKNKHAPLFTSLPEVKQFVRKYSQYHTLPVSLPELPPLPYDGITELWFDDVESIAKVFSSELYMEQIRPDEQKFLDLYNCSYLITMENIVI